MTSDLDHLRFIEMLTSFVDGGSRSTAFVREMEGEFLRLQLEEKEEFSDFQEALAMYRGYDEDVQSLSRQARYALQILSRK